MVAVYVFVAFIIFSYNDVQCAIKNMVSIPVIQNSEIQSGRFLFNVYKNIEKKKKILDFLWGHCFKQMSVRATWQLIEE